MSATLKRAARAAVQERENERDRGLMKRAALGDRSALEELYGHYHRRVYMSCYETCRSSEDAIDATQEAFLNVFQRLMKHGSEITSFRDYLFMTSRNASLKILAKGRRAILTDDVPEPSEPGLVPDASEDPQRSLMIGDQQGIVRRASRSLSKRQYRALYLYEVDGLSYQEIGEMLSLEANAVAQLIMRARQRLRKEVRQNAVATPVTTKTCARALGLLSKRVEGRLNQDEESWLEPHLAACDICKTNLAVMEEVGASYRAITLPLATLTFARMFSDEALAQAANGSYLDSDAGVSNAGITVKESVRGTVAVSNRHMGWLRRPAFVSSQVATSTALLLGLVAAGLSIPHASALKSFDHSPSGQDATSSQPTGTQPAKSDAADHGSTPQQIGSEAVVSGQDPLVAPTADRSQPSTGSRRSATRSPSSSRNSAPARRESSRATRAGGGGPSMATPGGGSSASSPTRVGGSGSGSAPPGPSESYSGSPTSSGSDRPPVAGSPSDSGSGGSSESSTGSGSGSTRTGSDQGSATRSGSSESSRGRRSSSSSSTRPGATAEASVASPAPSVAR